MRRIICCRFGNKFTQWHVDNLKYMIDNWSGIKYDEFDSKQYENCGVIQSNKEDSPICKATFQTKCKFVNISALNLKMPI